MSFWNRQNYGDTKKISNFQGFGGEEGMLMEQKNRDIQVNGLIKNIWFNLFFKSFF